MKKKKGLGFALCVFAVFLSAFPCVYAQDRDLINAARYNNANRVKRLLASSADPDFQDADSKTPLMVAAEEGGTETVKLLLDAGANPNI